MDNKERWDGTGTIVQRLGIVSGNECDRLAGWEKFKK